MYHQNSTRMQFIAKNKRLKIHGETYEQYLQSERWKNIRAKLKECEHWQKCHCCGSPYDINLHHKTYKHMYSNKICKHKNSIVALCRNCHKTVHEKCNAKGLGLAQSVRQLARKYKRLALKLDTSRVYPHHYPTQ